MKSNTKPADGRVKLIPCTRVERELTPVPKGDLASPERLFVRVPLGLLEWP